MNKYRLIIWSLLAIAGFLVVVYAVRRDIRYDKEYPCDLRNRVVGARLVKDGKDPYFYKWHAAEGLRYYDPTNCNRLPFSRTTVSPFFLRLLSPIAEWPEATISRLWLMLEYLCLLMVTGICWSIAQTQSQKQTVIVFAVLFLLTTGWEMHVYTGQMYLVVPLMVALFYVCGRRRKGWIWGAMAGLLAAALILIRLNAVLLFLPFLLILRGYDRRWLFAAGVAPLLLGAGVMLDHQERGRWSDYLRSTNEQVKWHQGLLEYDSTASYQDDPEYLHWEGVDIVRARQLRATEHDHPRSENGSLYIVYQLIFGHPLPIWAQPVICLTVIGIFLLFFCFRNRPLVRISLEQAVLFGYLLYMISDLCTPVRRTSYPAAQWLFPLLLTAAILDGKNRGVLWWLLAGIFLNIFDLPYWKMRNTCGEYLWLIVLLLLCLVPGRISASKSMPARVSADL